MDNLINQNLPVMTDGSAEKARMLQRQTSGAAGLSEKQRQQAKKVAQDFEGLFIGLMMKSMRETVANDKVTGGGHGEEIYRSMLDEQYVATAVKRGGFGMAKDIEKDIIRQESKRNSKVIDKKS